MMTPTAFGQACITQKLDKYAAGGGITCTIGTRTFSGFTPFVNNVDIAKITVTPINTKTHAGFEFSGFVGPNPGVIALTVNYTVSVLKATDPAITDVVLNMDGIREVVAGGVWNAGAVAATLSYKVGLNADILNVRSTSPLAKHKRSGATLTTPARAIDVEAGVSIVNVNANAGGTFTSFRNRFEPNP
jgi:hypothetical protein